MRHAKLQSHGNGLVCGSFFLHGHGLVLCSHAVIIVVLWLAEELNRTAEQTAFKPASRFAQGLPTQRCRGTVIKIGNLGRRVAPEATVVPLREVGDEQVREFVRGGDSEHEKIGLVAGARLFLLGAA